METYFEQASLVFEPGVYEANKVYVVKPEGGAGDLTFSRNSTATRVNSAGLIETVASNVPRLDYTNSTCPKLQLEPQRSNLALGTSDLNNPAFWTQENVTMTGNSVASPTGTQDADTIADNSTSGRHRISQTMSATNGTTYTYSVFVKKNSSGRFLLINANSLFNARAALNLDTLEVTNLNGTGKVEDYGNGWYRFSVTGTATATSIQATYIQMQASASDVNYIGDGSSFYLWGAQLEAGAYATSYIPTTTATVTRLADACSKTGISSLIGQTEGTIYWEGSIDGESSAFRRLASLSDGTTSEAIYIQNPTSSTTIQYVVVVGGVILINVQQASAFTFGQQFKVAAAYKANDFVLYINGVQVASATSGSVPATSKFAYDRGNNTTAFEGKVAQTLLFKTRLSNQQLAELTEL